MTGSERARQVELLSRGAAELISPAELEARLSAADREGRPLRVKLGADPTAPDIHLGHAVVIRKLRQFQDLGHEVYFVIGDFTGRIGDPSGRSATRPQLDQAAVEANARTYEQQIYKILDPDRTKLVFNSQWLAGLDFAGVIRLAAKWTVARMLERDDFSRRFREQQPIGVHEFLYPLAQAYDSVALRIDVEVGGTDQTYNFILTRELQRDMGLPPQVVLTMPLLEGLDGTEKMSKSLGNYIGIAEAPEQMYGKTMSLPDALLERYLTLTTEVPQGEVASWAEGMRTGRLNPRDVKMRLAREIVTLYHGAGAASAAEAGFVRVFSERLQPEDMAEVILGPGPRPLAKLLVMTGLVASASEARRMVSQGGVKVDGVRAADPKEAVTPTHGMVIQIGRRKWARVRLER